MAKFWTLITQLHSLAGPILTLLYPLYASVVAIESPSKLDDEQWLAYWIIYSFLTLAEMVLQPILEWVPIWYDVKLLVVAWLVLPQFKGAAYLYERFVREHIRKYVTEREHHQVHHKDHNKQLHDKKSPNGGKAKKKFVDFIIPNKEQLGDQEAY
ncbi:HVA22-like protein e [Gastrolobium bilobum]|uniref:HVA22-like protein e n=1 Tax=Gastrolobium bilobum TaxID=150636 RepID=UPI002AAF845F|nr:HVA22-like protein e [Gastrolobium bilobum]